MTNGQFLHKDVMMVILNGIALIGDHWRSEVRTQMLPIPETDAWIFNAKWKVNIVYSNINISKTFFFNYVSLPQSHELNVHRAERLNNEANRGRLESFMTSFQADTRKTSPA